VGEDEGHRVGEADPSSAAQITIAAARMKARVLRQRESFSPAQLERGVGDRCRALDLMKAEMVSVIARPPSPS